MWIFLLKLNSRLFLISFFILCFLYSCKKEYTVESNLSDFKSYQGNLIQSSPSIGKEELAYVFKISNDYYFTYFEGNESDSIWLFQDFDYNDSVGIRFYLDGHFYYDAVSKELNLTYRKDSLVSGFIKSRNKYIISYDLNSKEQLWRFRVSSGNDQVFIFDNSGGILRFIHNDWNATPDTKIKSIDAQSGLLIDSTNLSSIHVVQFASLINGDLFLGANDYNFNFSSDIYRLDASTYSVLQQYHIDDYFGYYFGFNAIANNTRLLVRTDGNDSIKFFDLDLGTGIKDSLAFPISGENWLQESKLMEDGRVILFGTTNLSDFYSTVFVASYNPFSQEVKYLQELKFQTSIKFHQAVYKGNGKFLVLVSGNTLFGGIDNFTILRWNMND